MNTSKSVTAFRRELKAMNKASIVARLLEMAGEQPGFADAFLTKRSAASSPKTASAKEIAELEEQLRLGIESTFPCEDFDQDETLSFRSCTLLARELINKGGCDAVLRVAEHFVEYCNAAYDENPYLEEVPAKKLLGLFLEALKASSLSEADQLLWAIRQCELDGFNTTEPYEDYLKEEHPADAWNEVAGILLEEAEQSGNAPDDRWTLHALASCEGGAQDEREKQADALRQNYAQAQIAQGNYDYAIRYYMSIDKNETALSLTEQALLNPNCRDEKNSLLDYKYKLYAAEEDEDGELFSLAEAFIESASVYSNFENYCAMKKRNSLAAKAEGCFIEYLEKGVLPWENPSWPGVKRTSTICAKGDFPKLPELLRFALATGDEELVLRCYQDDRQPDWSRDFMGDNVASLLQHRHPDVAIAIWQKQARQLMELCKTHEYPTACSYFRRIKRAMPEEEWQVYKDGLLDEYRKRRAFLPLFAKMDAEDQSR